MSETILEQIQADTRTAMKAGEKDRVGALRMLASVLQQDAKLGDDDPVAALQRERKKRLEAAEAFEKGGSADRAAAERSEAELIEAYLPAQLSDEELDAMVAEAIESTGASDRSAMGKVIGAVMGKAAGRADGKRVSSAVAAKLGS
jgi:uncharacterized protein YqeY